MSFLDKLERRLYKYSIPNLTIILIIGQIILFGLIYSETFSLEDFTLSGREVLSGQYWRILSFLFVPVTDSLIFAFFTFYLYYLYGTALESEWGVFKYNVYILLSYIFTVAIAFLLPELSLTNAYIFLSTFLAFAYLYPDFQLRIFFILPVKVKWLALIQWIIYGVMFLVGTWATRLMIVTSVGNYLLFFGKDIVSRRKYSVRRKKYEPKKTQNKYKVINICSVCGLSEVDDPNKGFRYCGDCDHKCYCMDHIESHECTK